jgi:hypothetical protein
VAIRTLLYEPLCQLLRLFKFVDFKRRAPLKQCIHFLYTAMVTSVYKLNAELAASLLASTTEMKATTMQHGKSRRESRSHFAMPGGRGELIAVLDP